MGNNLDTVSKGERTVEIAPFYNEQTKIITMPEAEVKIHPKGLAHVLFESMKENFGKISQRDAFTGESDTYDDLFNRSIRTAITLQQLGVKPGDRISLCTHNHIHCASAYLACILIGAICANLDPTLSQDDIEHLVGQVEPKLFFVSTNCESTIENVVKKLKLESKIVIFGETERNMEYSDFIARQENEDSFEPFVAENLQDTIIILFSSGSTGLPKGICLSHNFVCYHSRLCSAFNYMLFPTLYWVSANMSLIVSIRNGGARSFSRVFEPKLFWEHIVKYDISLIQFTPFEAMQFIDAKPEKCDDLRLQGIVVGGYSTTIENFRKMRAALPEIFIADLFAMTETGMLFSGMDPVSYRKVKSVGVPLPNLTYKIVDPDTEEALGFNQNGELRVKSKWFFNGYYNQDSSGDWDKDGFFKTGDVAYFDEDFSFFIVDRIKEMFKYKGMHITPVKLEKILITHPEIDRAVIIGIPDPLDEHRISAVVVPKPGSLVTVAEVEEFFNSRVDDRHRIRAGVRFVESVPLTPTCKVNRKELKRIILEGLK